MQCPVCQHEVALYFEVPGNSLEPFGGVDVMKSLLAWGGYEVPRTILCQQGEYTHFTFDHSGEAHLVKMVKFDQRLLDERHNYHDRNRQQCEYQGDEEGGVQCQDLGIPCYMTWSDSEPEDWYCGEHAHDAGFCPGCGLFCAGQESFDFSPSGLCGSCQEEFESEVEDEDDDDQWDGSDYDDDLFEDELEPDYY